MKERQKNENQHAQSLNASTEKKKVKAHDRHFANVPWCGSALCADNKHVQYFNLDIRAKIHKEENFHFAT